MANFVSYNIPARRTKSARVRTYQRLKGVDFSSDEAQVALQRSPNSLNMYKNYSVELGQCVETRPGFRRQVVFPEKEDNTVYGQLFFENRTKTVTKIQPLFHVGDTLYLWESYPQKADTLDETGQNPGLSALYTGLCCQDSAMMVFDGKVYILDGAHYLCFDGETVQEVKSLALVPTTYIGRDPLGGGTQYQQRNLLQDAFINTFLSDGKSQDYYLSMTDIDEVVRVEVDGRTLSADEYTVDAEEGKVTFTNVPPAPQTPGQDTVLIEAKKHTDGYAARIETCRVMAVFDNRLFCAGNPETPNVVYFSQRNDPTYFGEITYETDGKERCFWIGHSYRLQSDGDLFYERRFDGMMGEVRLWNKALTAEEIASENHFYKIDPASDGLVAYWKFDDNTKGKTVKDYTGNGFDLKTEREVNWQSVALPEE